MYDKLSIILTCLGLTGNELVTVEDDGSDEWNVASLAYEAGVRYLLGEHDWKFGTAIVALQRHGDSEDENYDDAYEKPPGTLGLIWVKRDGYALDWKIVGNKVVCNAASGVKAKIVLQPDPEEWPPLFVEALMCLVKAGIYEGLNEDPVEGQKRRGEAEAYLTKARTRSDREDAPRRVFRSRILARRRGLIMRPRR